MDYFDYKIDGTIEYPRETPITCRQCIGHPTAISNSCDTACYNNTFLNKIYPDYFYWVNNENQLINCNNSFYQTKNIWNGSCYTTLVHTLLYGSVLDDCSCNLTCAEIETNFILPPGCSANFDVYDASRNFLGKNKISGHFPGRGEVNCPWDDHYYYTSYVLANGLYVEFIPLPAWPAFCAAINRNTTNGWQYTKGFTALTASGGDNCSLPVYQDDDVNFYKYGVVGRGGGLKYHDCIYRVGKTSAEGLGTYIKYTACNIPVGYQDSKFDSYDYASCCSVQEYLNGQYPLIISTDAHAGFYRYGIPPDISQLCNNPSAWPNINCYKHAIEKAYVGPYAAGKFCYISGRCNAGGGQFTNPAVCSYAGILICEHCRTAQNIGYYDNQLISDINYSFRQSTMRNSSNTGTAANYPMIETNY